jgi:Tol biopolymer transport system component
MEGLAVQKTFQFVITAILGSGFLLAQAPRTAEVELKAAQQKADVEGDLNGAIKQYSAIIAKHKNDRAVTATALVHMAECYQKMGDAESRKIYEQVVREYADQKEAVTLARARLGGASPANREIATRRVWTGPKVDTLGSVSRDGRYLSFADWETGDLAIRELATGTDRRLSNKGTWNDSPEYAEESVMSPDGKQVACSWQHGTKRLHYDLRIASVTGKNPATLRTLYENEDFEWLGPYDWSPDGKWIAVLIDRKDRNTQIGLISTNDGSLRVLKSFGWGGPGKPLFSPDSKYLAFDLTSGPNADDRDVLILAVDGSREIPAVTGPANDEVLGWTPDGQHLLFASDRSGSRGMWALPIRDGNPQGSPELIKSDIGLGQPMGVTQSGSMYFGVQTDGPDVYVAGLDFRSGQVTSAPSRPVQHFIGTNSQPDWSHDGKYLAYRSIRGRGAEGGYVLCIRSVETGQTRELRLKMSFFHFPRWAPDGQSLVVKGGDLNGKKGVFRVDARTGELIPLVLSAEDEFSSRGYAELSPDERYLYDVRTASPDGNKVIERELASGSERVLPCRGFIRQISLSPDGRQLICETFDQGTKQMAVVAIPTRAGEPREIRRSEAMNPATGTRPGMFAGWAPDGRSILFAKGGELWLLPVEGGGEPRKTTFRVTSDTGLAGFRVHPDGTRIAWTAGNKKREVWVLENFLPVLQATR